MKYKYRIMTGITDQGSDKYSVQRKAWWFPFWYEIDWFWDEQDAIKKMDLEKKKNDFKSRVVRLG